MKYVTYIVSGYLADGKEGSPVAQSDGTCAYLSLPGGTDEGDIWLVKPIISKDTKEVQR